MNNDARYSIFISSALIYAAFAILIVGCSQDETIATACDTGYDMATSRRFQEALQPLTICVESKYSSSDVKRYAYVARAWSFHNLRNYSAAVADQEAAFQILPTKSYAELINYALYLRSAGRVSDSLAPIKKAEAMDDAEGHIHMMTQYHLGWTLQELGRHEEAIAAFSRGIPEQNDYAFAYLRRGISFDALGRKDEAMTDFNKARALVESNHIDISAKELSKIREKLEEYRMK